MASQLLEEEMARLRASARRLADQEKRFIRLYGMGEITEEYLRREADQVKRKLGKHKKKTWLDCSSSGSISGR